MYESIILYNPGISDNMIPF